MTNDAQCANIDHNLWPARTIFHTRSFAGELSAFDFTMPRRTDRAIVRVLSTALVACHTAAVSILRLCSACGRERGCGCGFKSRIYVGLVGVGGDVVQSELGGQVGAQARRPNESSV